MNYDLVAFSVERQLICVLCLMIRKCKYRSTYISYKRSVLYSKLIMGTVRVASLLTTLCVDTRLSEAAHLRIGNSHTISLLKECSEKLFGFSLECCY